MKKVLGCLTVLFVFVFIGMLEVNAADITISGGNVKGSKITVRVKGASGNVLSYEKDTLTCSSGEGCSAPNSSVPYGKEIKSDDVTFVFVINSSESKDIVFSVKQPGNDEGVIVSKSYSINPKTEPPKPTTPTTTKPQTTEQAKSNNANLKSLSITADDDSEVVISPEFNSSVYEYSATVAATVSKVYVSAVMEDMKANVVLSNNADDELVAGENNVITITVTAEDGTKKAYVVNIKREALTSDATLKSLSIKELPNFKLKLDEFSYDLKIDNDVDKLTLEYELNDPNSVVEITGNKNLKNGSKIKILVTAQDGTKKEYTLNIQKTEETTKSASNSVVIVDKNPIIIMLLSIVAFGLIGGILYVIKK